MTTLKSYFYKDLSQSERSDIFSRPGIDFIKSLTAITRIVNEIRTKGDEAVRKFTKELDNADINEFKVPESEIQQSSESINDDLAKAIRNSISNVKMFHSKQAKGNYSLETSKGVTCKRKFTAIPNVGLYVPSGTAPLFSSLIMSAVPAQTAGCEEIIVCSPPNSDGEIAPEILFVAKELGLTEIYKIGGAQAICAMAYGTESVPKVDKIFGPGNQYVTAAKYLVSNTCSIDAIAGPSEVLVIADETSNPEFVAADLISQAEHGEDSQVCLVTNSETVLKATNKALGRQTPNRKRNGIIEKVISDSFALVCDSLDQMMNAVNQYAPEHLVINSTDYKSYGDKVKNAGSVFLGPWSPEAAGDYISGTNHILPTMGFAKSTSGVSVEDFGKYITFQTLTEDGLKQLAPDIDLLANAESLEAHANSVNIRFTEQ